MKRSLLTFLAGVALINSYASDYRYSFKNTPVSQALALISKEHPEVNLSFIYNQLEDYKISADIDTDNLADAIRQIVAYNPISVIETGDVIYIEALQQGKFKYTGRVIDEHGETVPFATVMLLVPKDSTVITYGITDETGRFSIPCDRKNILAKISGVGYTTVVYPCTGFALGNLLLKSSAIGLKGVTVNGQNASLASDRSVYTPTNRQKRVAQDATDLLKVMAIPELRVDAMSGAITDNFGATVPVYINFMRASSQDMTGLRTADVKRVEFIYGPTDPRFQGARSVINIIVQEYEYGGYTKATVKEGFLTGLASNANLFSKFVYKKMTYDLYVGATNQNDHHNGNSVEAKYSLTDSDGNPTTVRRVENLEDSHLKQNRYPVTFRASYAGKNAQIRNTIGFTHLSKPENNENGSLAYYPSLGTDYEFSRVYSKRDNSLSYSGTYFFALPNKFSINANPAFSYSRIKDNMDYCTTAASPVVRNADEKAYAMKVNVTLTKQFDKKNSMIVGGLYTRRYNSIDYNGTNTSDDTYTLSGAAGVVGYKLKTQSLSLDVDVDFIWERNIINGRSKNDCYPAAHIQLGYAFNRKNRVSLFSQFASFTPEISEKTPEVLKQNELLYISGNPGLDNYRVYELALGYVWIPTNRFYTSIYGSYRGFHDRMTVAYLPYDDGKALLRTYLNDGDYNYLAAGFNFNLALLDRNLQISANPEYLYYRISGRYGVDLQSFYFNSSASYYVRDWYFQAAYKLPFKEVNGVSSNVVQKNRPQYSFTAGWSNGDLNVRFAANNIFNRGWLRYTREFGSPYYSEFREVYAPTYHPTINLSVVYTFGYGKKVKRGNEVGEQKGPSSAILK